MAAVRTLVHEIRGTPSECGRRQMPLHEAVSRSEPLRDGCTFSKTTSVFHRDEPIVASLRRRAHAPVSDKVERCVQRSLVQVVQMHEPM